MDKRVVEAVSSAYYARAIGAADLARARAQNGFTIASFLAGGITGAAVLSGGNTLSVPVRVAASVALAAWVFSAVLYAHAVSEPVRLVAGTQPDDEAFVATVLGNAAAERNGVDRRRKWAYGVSAAAAAATVVTALLTALDSGQVENATVILTPRGEQALQTLCGNANPRVAGEVDMAALDKAFVAIRIRDGGCHRREVRISRDDIVQILTEP